MKKKQIYAKMSNGKLYTLKNKLNLSPNQFTKFPNKNERGYWSRTLYLIIFFY